MCCSRIPSFPGDKKRRLKYTGGRGASICSYLFEDDARGHDTLARLSFGMHSVFLMRIEKISTTAKVSCKHKYEC